MENKVIDRVLGEKLEKMAKFRNILVHRYAIIETQRVCKIVKEDLKDIEDYIKPILKFVSKDG